MGLVWLENARRNSRPVAFSAPPTSLVRSNFGAYAGLAVPEEPSGVATSDVESEFVESTSWRIVGDVGSVGISTERVGVDASAGVEVSVGNGDKRGEVIGSVGSKRPGPSMRFTGDEVSRDVRRGIAAVLFDPLRGDFAAGFAVADLLTDGLATDGFVATTGLVLGRDARNSRGDRSRRSSNDQPRGRVRRAAWSSQRRFRCRCSSSSKFSSHTMHATRSMPNATSAGSLQPCFSQLRLIAVKSRENAWLGGRMSGAMRLEWWAMRASIPRLLRCERSALPTELIALGDERG